MKTTPKLLLWAIIGAMALTACTAKAENNSPQQMMPPSNEEGYLNVENVKTGLGIIANYSTVQPAEGGENGKIQADVTVAAVTIDTQGVILGCKLDQLQVIGEFTPEGQPLNESGQYISTKNELGDNYGMRSASAINKEWYEQAEAYSQWVVGKTAGDFSGGNVQSANNNEVDLASSVTIATGSFNEAIEKAIQNAR